VKEIDLMRRGDIEREDGEVERVVRSGAGFEDVGSCVGIRVKVELQDEGRGEERR